MGVALRKRRGKHSRVADKGTFERPFVLGIEGGGTRTTALLVDGRGRELQRGTFGPGNLRLLDDKQLLRLLRGIGKSFDQPDVIGLGLAGARNEKDRRRVRGAVAKVWKEVPCAVTHDLEVALGEVTMTAVLVLSGTGSCCFGKTADGRTAKMGGWGHVLGDKGSGFEIGLRGLKAVVFYFDRDGKWTQLGERLLAATGGNEPDDLVDWVANAGKEAVAALAVEVFAAAKRQDRIARDILKGAAASLAKDAADCAQKLVAKGKEVEFVLAGGVLCNQPVFAKAVGSEIRKRWQGARVRVQKSEGVWGAVEIARGLKVVREGKRATAKKRMDSALASTEKRNPRSAHLDRIPLKNAVELMLGEELGAAKAVRAESKKIARVAGWVAKALKENGRLFYVGAGTSGRLGVLDASECPPTFRAKAGQVQGIIAGGPRALTTAVEGAEDDAESGARAIQFRGVSKRDVVVGIAASGRTPFVWGALEEAARRGARTVLVCFDPAMKRRAGVPGLIVAPAVGPEVLTGSTRLKAGTATKLILNCITTLAFVRLGKVAGNLMIDLDPKNEKLRQRAVRIVSELTGANEAKARVTLEETGWMVRKALQRLRY